MADIVNLRQARKNRARAVKEKQAEENRALHGRTRAERLRENTVARKEATFLDGHRRDRAPRDE
jgi:hypothetical protein